MLSLFSLNFARKAGLPDEGMPFTATTRMFRDKLLFKTFSSVEDSILLRTEFRVRVTHLYLKDDLETHSGRLKEKAGDRCKRSLLHYRCQ